MEFFLEGDIKVSALQVIDFAEIVYFSWKKKMCLPQKIEFVYF